MARTGMTIDAKGTQGLFGNFSRFADTRDIWAGTLMALNNEITETHGKRINNAMQAIRMGRLAEISPLPEWQKEAIQREKRIREYQAVRNKIAGQVFDLEISLTPFDYSKEGISEFKLARLNDKYAAMNKDERKEALKQREYRMAVLYEPHQMSNTPKSDWEELRQSQIAIRHPDETARIRLNKSIIEEFDTSLKTLEAAHANEKRLRGADTPTVPTDDSKAVGWA